MQDIFDMSNIEWGREFSRLTVYNYVYEQFSTPAPQEITSWHGGKTKSTRGWHSGKNLPVSERVKNEQ